MSLRVKVECVLVVVIGLVIGFGYVIQRFVILPQLDPFEETSARKDMQRATDVLRDREDAFVDFSTTWAADVRFTDESIQVPSTATLVSENVSWGHIVSLDGSVLWSWHGDNVEPSGTSPESHIERCNDFLNSASEHGVRSGVIRSDASGHDLVAMASVTSADGENQATIVLAQALDERFYISVYNAAHFTFQAVDFQNLRPNDGEALAREALRSGQSVYVDYVSPELMSVYAVYPGVDGSPVLLLRNDVNRNVYAKAYGAVHQGLLVQIGVGLAALGLLILLFRANVMAPLTRLTRHTTAIKETNDLASRLEMTRDDEIGQLAGEFDRMVEVLERDVVQRESAEAALRESEERYALAVRGANDGLWDWDLVLGKVHYSKRWKTMLGLDEDNELDSPAAWLDRVHPEDLDYVKASLDAHVRGQSEHFESEHRLRHQGQNYIWVLCRGLAIRDENGKATRMAGSMADITLRKVFEDQLSYQALHDSLTALPNRLLFFDRLTQSLKRSQRDSDYHFSVLFLDIDRFKFLNDGLGHVVGDTLLTKMADRIEAAMESVKPDIEGNTISRFGGDEFAILLNDTRDDSVATRLAEEIIESLVTPFEIEGTEIFVGASIGIAMSDVAYDTAVDIVRNADTAMYRAKAEGKGGYAIFDDDMHSVAIAHLEIENDLRRAVDRNEFLVYYQPIIDLETGEVDGFEALVRWRHPKRGMVSPVEFVEIAEETGIIIPMGEFVLAESCRQVKEWQTTHPGFADLRISVNFSVREFRKPNLLEHIDAVLEETGIDAQHLKIEVTESVIIGGFDTMLDTLKALQSRGIELSIDDFGTGYSSLSYLHRFPMDTLKIDQAFVREMHVAKENYQIVNTIQMLAEALNMSVIAEGIEDARQLADLKAMGCEYGQGYYFSRPMDAEAAGEYLAETSRVKDQPIESDAQTDALARV